MRPLLDALRPIPGAFVRELRALTLHGPRAREPLKAVLSVLLAVTVAAALRLDDLSWAAFSGYMVMRADIAESIPRGLMRIAGTVGGALVALLLAPTVADTPVLLMLGLFVVCWIGTFQALTSRYSYAWLFFGLTAGMVMTRGPRRTGERGALRRHPSGRDRGGYRFVPARRRPVRLGRSTRGHRGAAKSRVDEPVHRAPRCIPGGVAAGKRTPACP